MIKLKHLLKESVTITVPDAREEYPDLHTIMDISFELSNKVLSPILHTFTPEELDYFKKNGRGYETITIDGYNVDAETGILNFYIVGIPPKYIPTILNSIKSHLDNLGIEVGEISDPEQSNMFKSKVIRIPIISNAASKMEKIPELNLANRNFSVLFHNILGIVGEDEYTVNTSVNELHKKIASFITGTDADQMKKLQPYTIDPGKFTVDPQLPGDEWKQQSLHDKVCLALGGSGYDCGITVDQLTRYFVQLSNMVQWAKKHGYNKIVGN